MHDTYKTYPIFHFFIQNIQAGVFPLWQPYVHAGEPFWTYLVFTGLLSPLVSATAIIAWLLQIERVDLLFAFSLYLHVAVFCSGLYSLAIRLFNQDGARWLRWAAAPLIFFGAFSINCWAQVFGTILIATWFPWILLWLTEAIHILRMGGRLTWGRTFRGACILSFGLASSNPMFLLTASAVGITPWLIASAGMRKFWHGVRLNVFRIALGALVACAFSLPTAILLKDQHQFFPIARYLSTNGSDTVYGAGLAPVSPIVGSDLGTPGATWDLVQSVVNSQAPDPLYPVHLVSELPQYFGVPGFFFLLVGLVSVWNRRYWPIVFPYIVLSWLSLGSRFRLSPLFYRFVPGFSTVRHLEFFGTFAWAFGVLVVLLGLTEVVNRLRGHISRHSLAAVTDGLAIAISIGIIYQFGYHLGEDLQSRPLAMGTMPFRGRAFSSRRIYTVAPISQARFRDASHGNGEFLLLYRDSLRVSDNQQFTMPISLAEYLVNTDPQMLRQMPEETRYVQSNSSLPARFAEETGISRDKLRVTAAGSEVVPKILGFSANHLTFAVDCPTPCRGFYSQTLMPGWIAAVDGRTIPLVRASHPFMEFELPKGSHNVQLSYRYKPVAIALCFLYMGQAIFLIAGIARMISPVTSGRGDRLCAIVVVGTGLALVALGPFIMSSDRKLAVPVPEWATAGIGPPSQSWEKYADPRFSWLNVVRDFWDIDAQDQLYSRRVSNTLQEGNGILLSRQAYGDYELHVTIHNPNDGGIIARWRNSGNLELLVVKENRIYWHHVRDGKISMPISEHQVHPRADQLEVRLTAGEGVLRVKVWGEDAGAIDDVIGAGKVGLYSFRNGSKRQSFGPVEIDGSHGSHSP